MTGPKVFLGVDRGFLFFENEPGIPWRGLIDLEEREEDYQIETYYLDGKVLGHRYLKGSYAATVTSFDNPIPDRNYADVKFGFSYRETFQINGEEHYRLHIVHGVSIVQNTSIRDTMTDSPEPTQHSWELISADVQLTEELEGSHLILDSSVIYPWVMRDIEAYLYGYPDGDGSIPSIDQLYEFFAMMNLVIIDHGDGTWSAVGHDTMVAMIDATEFEIVSPTIEFVEGEEHTFEIESLIRDERWLE